MSVDHVGMEPARVAGRPRDQTLTALAMFVHLVATASAPVAIRVRLLMIVEFPFALVAATETVSHASNERHHYQARKGRVVCVNRAATETALFAGNPAATPTRVELVAYVRPIGCAGKITSQVSRGIRTRASCISFTGLNGRSSKLA